LKFFKARTLISGYCVRFGRHFQSSGLNRLIQWHKQVEISGNYYIVIGLEKHVSDHFKNIFLNAVSLK